jgi:predicted dehydrogenase
MKQVYGLGVIGCGDIATTQHLPALVAAPRVRLAAVCDADEGRARAAAQRFGAPRHATDYRAVLDDPLVDAVVVATPPWVTPRLTMEALRAGKDVLCEKPMATSLPVAREVAAVERETGGLVQVGFTYRHGPLMEALRGWIAAGRLGRPLALRVGIFDELYDPQGHPEQLRADDDHARQRAADRARRGALGRPPALPDRLAGGARERVRAGQPS